MKFNSEIKTKIYPFLKKYGFDINEDIVNQIKFTSSSIELKVVFNKKESSYLVEVGKVHDILFPLNDMSIKLIFNSNLSIENVTLDCFVNNLLNIFKSKVGIDILTGNINFLQEITINESKKYTINILNQQYLDMASEAWKNKDIIGFLKNIDYLGVENISQSLKIKYNIAKKMIATNNSNSLN